jgi:pimeloyl-ACP methyl ester carboxylesterase
MPSDDNTAHDLQHNPQNERRRKLLCIYVHGFMGNETSFRSFPAHVHNLLAVLLAETHAVHTKIYPRYRSRRNITCARDDFSAWLTPHEGDNTDVVLLGHSMGGLVIAEVALMPSPTSDRPLKHRIVGTVNFDVPFLGMHPGVVKSGLASIFSAPPEEPTDRWQDTQLGADTDGGGPSNGQRATSPAPSSMSDELWRPEKPDPNFNPSFQNDVKLSTRKGWSNAWHFVSKHSDNLREATKQLVTSHLEFGGAMANYGELKTRYARLRALEEDSDAVRKSVVDGGVPPRVRFVNYYTASTGRPKKPKTPQEELPEGVGSTASLEIVENSVSNQSVGSTRSPSPGVKPEEHDASQPAADNSHTPLEEENRANESDESSLYDDARSSPEMLHVDPTPVDESDDAFPEAPTDTPNDSQSSAATQSTTALSTVSSLPPIPDMPTAPAPLDVSYIEDKQTRKLVEKEHTRATKAYEKAVKERERVIRDRAKLEEKREKKEKKESTKAEKEAQKARQKAEKEDGKQVKKMDKAEIKELTHAEKEEKRLAAERERMEKEARRMRGEPEPEAKEENSSESERPASEPSAPPTIASSPSPAPQIRKPSSKAEEKEKEKEKKPPKDRKFCTLPPKDSQGQRDPCWPRVFMKDVDEVGAHCGLFFVDERYERLVGDVAERVEGWVKDQGGIEAGMERMRMKS